MTRLIDWSNITDIGEKIKACLLDESMKEGPIPVVVSIDEIFVAVIDQHCLPIVLPLRPGLSFQKVADVEMPILLCQVYCSCELCTILASGSSSSV